MMNEAEKRILEELIDAYERSALFHTGKSKQRVYFNFSRNKALLSQITDPEIKTQFLEALKSLKDEGFLDFTWVRFEKGNLVNNVYLNSDPEVIQKIYQVLRRTPKQILLERFLQQLLSADCKDGEIAAFLGETANYVEEKREFPPYFFRQEQEEKNERLIAFLSAIGDAQEEQMERVLSARLFGDSKYFEQELKGKVLQILKQIRKARPNENEYEEYVLNPDRLLQEKGVFRWPEILEFCGNVIVSIDAETEKEGVYLREIDYSSQVYGAYINSKTIRQIRTLELADVNQIITIENKANYVWYIQNQKRSGELVLFHGGFLSPAKKEWFQKIAASAPQDCRVYHWGDIDLGGFLMFRGLKNTVFPGAVPFRMNLETLKTHENQCMKIETESYKTQLKKLLSDDTCKVFQDVIAYMLERGIRLEQENLIE